MTKRLADAPPPPALTGTLWTDTHERQLINLATLDLFVGEIADLMGRSADSIRIRAKKLGVRVAEESRPRPSQVPWPQRVANPEKYQAAVFRRLGRGYDGKPYNRKAAE